MTFIGVDPGASGGLAALNGKVIVASAMPETPQDIRNWVETVIGDETGMFAVLEKVQGYIGVGHPGSGMFKFGKSAGWLEMTLVCAGIPYEEVTPQKWQKALGIPKRDAKKESKQDFKRRLRAFAQRLFPNEKVTLATCDALLMAEFARRKSTGTL